LESPSHPEQFQAGGEGGEERRTEGVGAEEKSKGEGRRGENVQGGREGKGREGKGREGKGKGRRR